MRRHFMFMHNQHAIHIVEEGNTPFPRCEECGMHLKNPNTASHRRSHVCQQGRRKRRERAKDVQRKAANEVVFYINGNPIENVKFFKYLGRWVSRDDNDHKAISENIKKASKRWSTFSRVLVREGANYKTMGIFYKTVVMSVLLYGAETWTLTQRQTQMLASFHNRCARNITGRGAYEQEDGTWVWPSLTETLEMAGLAPIHEYIHDRKAHFEAYAQNRDIYHKCTQTKRNPSKSHKNVWWEQEEVE